MSWPNRPTRLLFCPGHVEKDIHSNIFFWPFLFLFIWYPSFFGIFLFIVNIFYSIASHFITANVYSSADNDVDNLALFPLTSFICSHSKLNNAGIRIFLIALFRDLNVNHMDCKKKKAKVGITTIILLQLLLITRRDIGSSIRTMSFWIVHLFLAVGRRVVW